MISSSPRKPRKAPVSVCSLVMEYNLSWSCLNSDSVSGTLNCCTIDITPFEILPFGFSQVCTSASSKFVVKTYIDYAPSPCSWLSQPQTTTGCCHSDSTAISCCLETLHTALLIILSWVSVVPYDISLHTTLVSVSTPSATFLSVTGGLKAHILIGICTATGRTYALAATENLIRPATLHFGWPYFTKLASHDSFQPSGFYTHSSFMDSRITYCRLRLFSRDFAELYTVFRQWNTAYRRLRALNTCFCSVREFHPYFHHRVQALFGLSVFIPRFRDGCTETTRTCPSTGDARK